MYDVNGSWRWRHYITEGQATGRMRKPNSGSMVRDPVRDNIQITDGCSQPCREGCAGVIKARVAILAWRYDKMVELLRRLLSDWISAITVEPWLAGQAVRGWPCFGASDEADEIMHRYR